MGASTAQRISSNGEASTLPVALSQSASSSGDVVPVTFNAEMATQQHHLIQGKIDTINAQLDEVVYDSKTGAKSPAITGRDRDLLEINRAQFNNELQYLGMRALEQLPKVGDANAAKQTELEAAAKRQIDISTLADTQGADGRLLGRVAAAKLIDEAIAKRQAEKLVRS